MNDPLSVIGIAGLVNPANINNNIDLDKLEHDFIENGLTMRREIHDEEYDDFMRELESEISMSDDSAINMSFPEYVSPHREEKVSERRPIYQPSSDIYNYKRPHYANPHNEAVRMFNDQSYEQIKMEKIQIEEEKSRQLEDIEELRFELESEKIDTSGIAHVNKSSSPEEVDRVHRILKRRYTRLRCESVGDEAILSLVQILELFLDGEKSYFGYKPDLTGWSPTVRSKLRKMKYEKATVVNDVLDTFNIGAGGRILLELIPSAFVYSGIRQRQKGQNNFTPNQDQVSEALDDLYAMDE